MWPLWFTTDKQVKDLIHERRAMKYLERHYLHCFKDYPAFEAKAEGATVPKQIWICWLQGIEHAPKLVQQCVESVKKQCPDFQITILTEQTLFDYVSLPEDVVAKYKSGRLPFPQFSDIVRVALLAQHGGIWMDATVFMSGKMPEYVTEGPLFMFRTSFLSPSKHVASNWFLASVPNHPVMLNMRDVLCEYWRRESFLRDYYIFHDLLGIAYQKHAQTRQCIDTMPYINNVDPHALMLRVAQQCQTHPEQPYSEALKRDILSHSNIHKLSYKNAVDYSLYLQ